ncbi:hypothetical protein [Pseudomonas proteolytica]|uniref:Restriction endonuclease type IV Mrr domain-containing protein n=1 Tax=Pseudomonas proteolytica TaxID=219574 RepID=A0AAW5AE83_9PSED|nr:hypothetical protein [Pseudomonas proteolytica]KAA8698229.1 hypothetical protein F4W61_25975 [Pseudomonas proteolytica]MCF5061115.1 hypothetical protein [Pseudomonas proteolytica]MCF5104923.1 hypothetical protein [Pseudomonas proteolytica]TWR84521.1 hypothetical protein FIV38_07475 [Pseudomonas proteolytica]SED36305.1 hypothetical protein SAMN04490200_1164 [Pseudomonas proteolytica]
MNIESLTRLIESVNVTDLRTLCAHFLPEIGLPSAVFSDGPYDGGKDYAIYDDPIKGVKIGIQLSVETKWKKKVHADASKTKNNYNTNLMYFFSSRRIPDGSFEKERTNILSKLGVTVIKYDCQAIATKFIQANKVSILLKALNIEIPAPTDTIKKYLGAKNEAISSLLMFDTDAQDFRVGLYDSIVKSVLARQDPETSRAELIAAVLSTYEMDDTQGVLINSHVDRLLQRSEILSEQGKLKLHETEHDTYAGLRAAAEVESNVLKDKIIEYFTNKKHFTKLESFDLLIDNFLLLSAALLDKNFTLSEDSKKENEAYFNIRNLLESTEGEKATNQAFSDLSTLVANSEFAKLVASAKLYDCMMNADSSRLISALGGHQSINVYLDSSVAIPIICGLLYDTVEDRYSRSGKTLYSLMASHEFSSVIPADYIEEVGAHLIEACRDYTNILLDEQIDLTRSGNAFVSHYSHYIKSPQGNGLTFSDYVDALGVKLSSVSHQMSDGTFYKLRDRACRAISNIAEKYGFIVENMNPRYVDKKITEIEEVMAKHEINKPPVLIRHDATVIEYLSGAYIPSGLAKVLCTWDKLHLLINPAGLDGYYVMNPIVLIDFLSIARKTAKNYSMAHLLDFAAIQNERNLELSAKIWDSIAKLDSKHLADAMFMRKAKQFKEDYLEKHLNEKDDIPANIEKAWLAWKKTSEAK